MRKRPTSPVKRNKGGKLLPALCNLLGVLILLAIIVSCLMIIVPQFRGYQAFHVVSGSMEPEIPVGSIVYVKSIMAKDVQAGDVIAFQSGNTVVTHRVVKNFLVEGEFSTKGDANPEEDDRRVDYGELIGVVTRHYPHLGEFLVFYSTLFGKIYILLFAACGAMLNILASRLRSRYKEVAQPAEPAELKPRKPDCATPPEG